MKRNMTQKRKLILLAGLAFAVFLQFENTTWAAARSEQDKPNGKVGGVVISAQTGEFLKGALVSLRLLGEVRNDEGRMITTVSGPDGRYHFTGLPAGSYELSTSKSGYHPRFSSRQRITLTPEKSTTTLVTRMWRTAVIAGLVRDPDGEPSPGARVSAYRVNYRDGEPFLQRESSALTDDLGEFRIFDLAAGKYTVGASLKLREAPQGVLALEFGSVFYPNATLPSQAARMKLAWGEELEIDLDLLPAPVTLIAGVVLDEATGRACDRCSVWASSMGNNLPAAAGHSVRTREDGHFVIRGLVPATYRLTASSPGRQQRMASHEIQLGEGRIEEVTIAVDAGREVAGVVDWDVSAPDAMVEELRSREVSVLLSPEPGNPSRMSRSEPIKAADNSFVLKNVPPGAYRVRVASLPPQVYLEAVLLSGRKLDEPRIVVEDGPMINRIRLTLAFDGATVHGRVIAGKSGDNDGPILPGTVVLVPRARNSNYLARTKIRYSAGGSFSFDSVPPGLYGIFATAQHDPAEFEAPELRTSLEKVVRHIRIDPHERMNVEVPLIDSVIGID